MTKKKLLAPLFIAASFLLIGCSADTIVGRPGWINQNIINGDYKDNKMKDIYDAIKALGDTNSNVLNKVMYQIAQNQLGHFEKWEDAKGEHLGLKEIATGSPTIEQIDQFVKDYPAYAVGDKENECYDKATDTFRELTQEEKREVSLAKIKDQYDGIINRVCELMYNEVKDGSYTTDGVKKLFSEKEYIRHLRKELYHPVEPTTLAEGKQVFVPKPTGMDWKDFVNSKSDDAKSGYLHIMNGNDFTEIYYPQTADGKDHGYIGRKILPDVYRELLIENYVREQRYTNLGRAYARKVKVVKIANSAYYIPTSTMLNNYAKTYITGDGASDAGKAKVGNLEWLNEAMIGIVDDTYHKDAQNLLTGADFTTIKANAGTKDVIQWKMHIDENGEPTTNGQKTNVYYGTKLGDMVEKFMKAFNLKTGSDDLFWGNFKVDAKFPLDEEAQAAYNEFTNNGAYPVEVGIELKERELLSNDITQDGWFMKSGGLTDITDTFRNQLFSINTSQVIDKASKMVVDVDHPGWCEYTSGDYARYFENIAGDKSAYIVEDSVEESEVWRSVVLQDDSLNLFIIQVDEAASLAKLSYEDESGSYIKLKATTGEGAKVTDSNKAMNEIVHGITKSVASGDTYKKNAEQYYLMISNILFYDQSVYDYFKSQFPELFK